MRMDSGDGCITIWMYILLLNCTLKNSYAGKFYVVYVYHSFFFFLMWDYQMYSSWWDTKGTTYSNLKEILSSIIATKSIQASTVNHLFTLSTEQQMGWISNGKQNCEVWQQEGGLRGKPSKQGPNHRNKGGASSVGNNRHWALFWKTLNVWLRSV